MGTWRKVCTGIAGIIMIIMLYLSFWGSPITAWQLERQVERYLLETGLSQEDILSSKTVYQRDKQTNYIVQVIFVAEPEIVHYYYYNVDKEIQEMEYISQ